MKSIKFKEFRVADVSTIHLCIPDLKAVCDKESPSHSAQHDQGFGDWFYVAQGNEFDVDEWLEELSKAFSPAFVDLMNHIQLQGFDYVNFDADGSIVEGFPQFTGRILDGVSNWNYPVGCFDEINTVDEACLRAGADKVLVVAMSTDMTPPWETYDNPELTTFEVNSIDDVPEWATHLVAVERK